MSKQARQCFILFFAGLFWALGAITVFKFQDAGENLLGFLVAMFCIPIGFSTTLVAKRRFKKFGIDVGRHIHEVFFNVNLFLPILVFKFVVNNIWPSTALAHDVYTAITLTVVAVVVALTVRGAIAMAKYLKDLNQTSHN